MHVKGCHSRRKISFIFTGKRLGLVFIHVADNVTDVLHYSECLIYSGDCCCLLKRSLLLPGILFSLHANFICSTESTFVINILLQVAVSPVTLLFSKNFLLLNDSCDTCSTFSCETLSVTITPSCVERVSCDEAVGYLILKCG